MSAQLQEVAFFSFHSKVFKEVLFLYFMSLVSSWAGWLWASQEIAAAALPCAVLARAVPAACRGCSAPAAGGTGGVSAPCIPPAPTCRSVGEFCSRELRVYSTLQGRCSLTQRGLEFVRWPFRLASEQVSVQGIEGSILSLFFKRLPSKWWLLLTWSSW